MKRIVQPVLVVLTGLIQAILATFLLLWCNTLTLLWNADTVPLRRFSLSSHGIAPPTYIGMVLGYLDGTLGLWSMLIPYDYVKVTKVRVQLMVKRYDDTNLLWREEVTHGLRLR